MTHVTGTCNRRSLHRWLLGAFVAAIPLGLTASASAAVSFGATPSADASYAIQFQAIGITNPSYSFHNVPEIGDLNVSFGTHFVGQTFGAEHNSLADTSPNGPLTLAHTPGMGVKTQFDLSHPSGPVLGGYQGMASYTTPLAILFDAEVNYVTFNLGHLDAHTDTLIQAYDSAGNSLGIFGNLAPGHQIVSLVETSGTNTIGGISIYVPAGGMDWEGFGISDFEFGVGDDGDVNGGGDPQVPEPASLVVWSLLGGIGVAGAWYTRRGR